VEETLMKAKRLVLAAAFAAACVCLWDGTASAWVGDASDATIAARQKFFGPENVDPRTGEVRRDKVIFAWFTNASIAASIKGRIVLLDTYVNRLEVAPAAGQPDLRRTPFSVQDLIDLHPEALFPGHGHGDHADNAAYIAKWLNIPVYASPETCAVLQVDVTRLWNDPNTVNGGVKLIPDSKPITCIPTVPLGSVPGAVITKIDQLEPVACILVFKHIHSGTVPRDPTFPFTTITNDYDPRESAIYPPGTCVAPFVAGTTKEPAATVANIGPGATGGVLVNGITGLSCPFGTGAPLPVASQVPGQMNLTTTGFGNIPGASGGSISMFYQIILRHPRHFAFVWHNTTGPLKEGFGSDPGLTSPVAPNVPGYQLSLSATPTGNPVVGAHLFSIMDSLPQTAVEFGAILSIGFPNNGVRDEILYQQHIKPKVYVPLHMTDVADLGSSLQFKKGYLITIQEALAQGAATYEPELRWQVDPDDYSHPMVYDPDDPHWAPDPGDDARVRQFCGG
jgi:hypothetical protein